MKNTEKVIGWLRAAYLKVDGGASLDELADVAADMAAIEKEAAAVRKACERRIGQLHPVKAKLEVAGAVVKIEPAKDDVEWDDDGLLAAVVARGADSRRIDLETGDVLESEGAAVARTIQAVYPLVGRTARVTALSKIGIDPDEYRASSPSDKAPKVTVER